MLTFLHFAVASLGSLFVREKRMPFIRRSTLLPFLIAGFIGILPDMDLLFNWTGLGFSVFVHRGIFHSIIFSVIFGLITLFVFHKFWFGFFPHISHLILDIIDPFGGPVMVFPGLWLSQSLGLNRDILSGVLGTMIILGWIIYDYIKSQDYNEYQKSYQQ